MEFENYELKNNFYYFRMSRLAFVITFTLFDIGFAIYNELKGNNTKTGYSKDSI